MNKREKAELINLITPLDNLFFIAEHIEDNIMNNINIESQILKNNIEEYKQKLFKNLNVIEETKDILMEIVHLKVESERIKNILIKEG
mgnify:CR=1 FL=1